MKIHELIQPEFINLDMCSTGKKDAIEEIAKPVSECMNISHEAIVKTLLEREQLGSTGIGGGVAIPHGKSSFLEKVVIGFGRSRKGVNFDSIDLEPVSLFFMILTPEESISDHLKALAKISYILKTKEARTRLLSSSDKNEIIEIIKKYEPEN